MTFSPSLWIALMVTFLALSLVIRGIAQYSKRSLAEVETFRNLSGCCYVLLAAFFGVSVPIMPRTLELRFLFDLWVLCSFAFTTVFQTFFTSYLVDPGLLSQVSSVNELIISPLTLTLDVGYYYLFDDTEELDSYIVTHAVVCDGFSACSRRVAAFGDTATVLDIQTYDFYNYAFEQEFRDTLLCRLPERIKPYQVAMFIQKGNPLFGIVNDIIMRFVEGGFVELWREKVLTKFLVEKKVTHEEETIPYFVLSLKHLYVAFSALALGNAVSVCVFLTECLSFFLRDCCTEETL